MDTLAMAVSGLRSAEMRLAASAHNVANLTTDRFHHARVLQTEAPAGGSIARLERAATPAPVNLAHEAVELLRASLQYTASGRVFSVESDLRGELFDLLV